jgi:hypothetical protein
MIRGSSYFNLHLKYESFLFKHRFLLLKISRVFFEKKNSAKRYRREGQLSNEYVLPWGEYKDNTKLKSCADQVPMFVWETPMGEEFFDILCDKPML